MFDALEKKFQGTDQADLIKRLYEGSFRLYSVAFGTDQAELIKRLYEGSFRLRRLNVDNCEVISFYCTC